jgi:hypothetical protein
VVGCLVPMSVVCLTFVACTHIGKDAEIISEVEVSVEQILLFPDIS